MIRLIQELFGQTLRHASAENRTELRPRTRGPRFGASMGMDSRISISVRAFPSQVITQWRIGSSWPAYPTPSPGPPPASKASRSLLISDQAASVSTDGSTGRTWTVPLVLSPTSGGSDFLIDAHLAKFLRPFEQPALSVGHFLSWSVGVQ